MYPRIRREGISIKPTRAIQKFLETENYNYPSFDCEENENIIYLDKNENPFIPPLEINSLEMLSMLRYYPDPNSSILLNALSKNLDVPISYLIAGSGSDELLDLIFKTYSSSKTKILSVSPTFSMYKFYVSIYGANFEAVPLILTVDNQTGLAKFKLNHESFSEKANSSDIIILARPNNPDGMMVSKKYIKSLLELNKMVIVDEAYIEFSEKASFLDQINNYDNLILLRSFSKSYSLAGLRLGYLIANPSIINVLAKVKSPFNVNNIAQNIAVKLLNNSDEVVANNKKIQSIRNQFFSDLLELQRKSIYFYIHQSEANFVLLRFQSSEIATSIFQHFLNNDIAIRKYSVELANCLRISIGTSIQMKEVIRVFLKYLEVN
jgi:histidinol-phosphate aminotransferase